MIKSLAMAAALAAVPALAVAAPVETQVEIKVGVAPLKATLLAPEGKAKAAVVILPGSGPTDRDGNNPLGVKGSSYKRLAEGLAAEGVASLRMDKRGMFGSASLVVDPYTATVTVLAEDAKAWAGELKTRTGLDCVWLAGHSEGGLVALIAGAQDNPDICGLVLIAAPGRPLGTVLREQLQGNPANAPVLPQALKAIDELEAGRTFDSSGLHPGLQGLFNSKLQPFLIESLRQDPARLAAATRKPILIVQGEADIQVSVTDAKALKAAQPKAELLLMPGMNHVLKAGGTDRAETAANYADPASPLAPGLVEAIARFVKAR